MSDSRRLRMVLSAALGRSADHSARRRAAILSSSVRQAGNAAWAIWRVVRVRFGKWGRASAFMHSIHALSAAAASSEGSGPSSGSTQRMELVTVSVVGLPSPSVAGVKRARS